MPKSKDRCRGSIMKFRAAGSKPRAGYLENALYADMASYLLHSKLASPRHLLTAIAATQHRQQSMQHLQYESEVSSENMNLIVPIVNK